jgi:drug/metabolite transporter (DMT)-like permease
VIDTGLWGQWLIWISAILTVWSMVYYLQKAIPEIRARPNDDDGLPPYPDRAAGWLRAMPVVFVLIWSTGFIVARYGMPYAPPLKFLAVRYALSLVCFLHLGRAGAGRLAEGARAMGPPGGHGRPDAGGLPGRRLGRGACGHGRGARGAAGRPAAGADRGLAVVRRRAHFEAPVGRPGAGPCGLVLVVSRKLGQGSEVNALTMGLAVMALLSITAGTLYQKRFVAPCDVRTAKLVQTGGGLAGDLALRGSKPKCAGHRMERHSTGAMAWSVLALTLGGSSLLYMLIQRGAATAVTSLLYLVPPCTAVMAWLLFGEPITLVTLLGIGAHRVGVSLVVRSER